MLSYLCLQNLRVFFFFLVYLESNYQTAIRLFKIEKAISCLLVFNTSYHMQQGIRRIKGERSLLKEKSMHYADTQYTSEKTTAFASSYTWALHLHTVFKGFFLTTGSLDVCLQDEKSHQSLSDSQKIKNHYWITVHLIYLVLMCH